MREHAINQLDNFIAGWYFDDTSICDEIINYHRSSPNKKIGLSSIRINNQYQPGVDKSNKDSVDCVLEGSLLKKYGILLQSTIDFYIKKYPFCNFYNPWKIKDCVNVQFYPKNGGYHAWHTERGGGFPEIVSSRHLTFITYLNDVNDGGYTEFFHQKISVKAEKGLTIIWPVDWTFTHRGVASASEEKYIVTGWLNYF